MIIARDAAYHIGENRHRVQILSKRAELGTARYFSVVSRRSRSIWAIAGKRLGADEFRTFFTPDRTGHPFVPDIDGHAKAGAPVRGIIRRKPRPATLVIGREHERQETMYGADKQTPDIEARFTYGLECHSIDEAEASGQRRAGRVNQYAEKTTGQWVLPAPRPALRKRHPNELARGPRHYREIFSLGGGKSKIHVASG